MINRVKNSFRSKYGIEAQIIVKAPGRINLIGEHTDYNAGLVLPAAIDKCMYFTFASNDSGVAKIYAMDLAEEATVHLDDLKKTDSIWTNYIVGLLIEFQSKGVNLTGFDCVFSSDIPIGAGMSSSAALECGFAVGIDYLLQSNLEKWVIVDMSHHSNHTFMNIYGGILDQFSSLFGQAEKCMLMDCRDRSFSYHDIDLEGYSIVLINTNVKHEHTTSGYNDRASECRQIELLLANYDSSLRSISDASIETITSIGQDWPENLLRRAKYIINENERVRKFSQLMSEGEFEGLGDLLYQSHFGLQHLYEVSCLELDLLVDLTRDREEIIGARMMGGGFGGCTINIMKSDQAKQTTEEIMSTYEKRTGIEAQAYFVKISDGASVELL